MSFIRSQYTNRIPMGGNGGDGGGILIKASERINNLHNLKRSHYNGNDGKSGLNKNCGGKCGSNIVIKIPIGTLVYEIPELSRDPKNFGIK